MPQHPGSVGRPTHGLSAAARAVEGIPQSLPQDEAAAAQAAPEVAELLAQLRGGQLSAETLLQLLTLLAGLGPGGLPGAAASAEELPPEASQIERAFLG